MKKMYSQVEFLQDIFKLICELNRRDTYYNKQKYPTRLSMINGTKSCSVMLDNTFFRIRFKFDKDSMQ